MSTILFGMKDVGGANAVLPVAIELAGQYGTLDPVFYADGVSFDRFKTQYPLISAECNPSTAIGFLRPRVVVTTTCSPGGVVPMELVIAAKNGGIPVVVVQDYWGNHLKHEMWGDSDKRNPKYLPDIMCVQDEFSRNIVLGRWSNFDGGRVVITGQPAFDRLKGIDCGNARYHLRKTLGLTQDWPIVHFSGQIWGMPEAVQATIDALNFVGKPVYLVMRDHPRLFASNAPAEFREIYRKYADDIWRLESGQVIGSSDVRSSDPINAGCDIVVSMYSGALVEACYLRKDCVSVWIPEAQAALAMETKNTLFDFPPAALGACLRGTNAEELVACFERIFSGNTGEMRAAQERHFVSDGQSAHRVADVVRGFA